MLMLCLGASFAFASVQASGTTAPLTPAPAPPQQQVAPSASPAHVPTPADPKQRLELAGKLNGLEGWDIAWHLKASYEVFGADGESKDKGTYEEWRKDAKQYKRALHSPAISVEEYGTDHGIFRSTGQDWPDRPLSLIPDLILRPASPREPLDKVVLQNYERAFGSKRDSKREPCTALIFRGSKETTEDAASFCFGRTDAMVFYSSSSSQRFMTLFENISYLHGRYLAHDMELLILGKPWLKVHIEPVTLLAPSEETVLVVPSTAQQVNPPAMLPASVITGRLIAKVPPSYPSEAKFKGVQGTVLVSAIIGKDGHMKKVEVLAGPPMLQKPASDAVMQWVYQPSLRDGRPVEVDTVITVIFNLGGER